ncbi:MAG: TatD family hydrolase [Muribaculaceae bacterium]|nr:TatD family hydrolase [Muribaculaceae bacterium]
MNDIIDFHTHQYDTTAALIAVDPRQFDPQPGLWYSVGFHPWNEVEKITEEDFDLLRRCAAHPQVLAIGETGMDALRGASLDIQGEVFSRHLLIAADVAKPVVVHSVRTVQNILSIRRKSGLTAVPLAIHGMRSNAHVAQTWLDAGCYLSFGARFNPAALLATPIDRLLIETDDSDTPINEVATLVAQTLHLTTAEVIKHAIDNARQLLNY